MKILAVDYGDSRTGLAISDPSELLATPLKPQIEEKSMVKVAAKICEAAQANRAQKSRKLAAIVEQQSGLPVRMWDERQTTITAAGILRDNGTFGKKRKAILDAVSASVILENYLAWRRNHPGEED